MRGDRGRRRRWGPERVRLADCGKTAAGELLAGLAAALGSAAAADPDGPCVYVFAEQDRAGFTRWATARQFPAAWPQGKPPPAIPWPYHRLPRPREHGRHSRQQAATSDPSAAGNVAGSPCPALGAEWERRSAASYGQTRSDALIVARSNHSDVPERRRPADLPTWAVSSGRSGRRFESIRR